MFNYVFKFNAYWDFKNDCSLIRSFSADNLKQAWAFAMEYMNFKFKCQTFPEGTEIIRIAKYPNGEVIFDKDINCRD